MKLYCVKFKNVEENIIDVTHLFANDNNGMHERLVEFISVCQNNGLTEYNSYSFFEVGKVDGIDVSRGFEKYKIDGNKIVLK